MDANSFSKFVSSQLFYDIGNIGYNEEYSIKSEVEIIYNEYRVAFELKNVAEKHKITQIRFDPSIDAIDIELEHVVVKYTDGVEKSLNVLGTNGVAVDKRHFIFEHEDPIIIFDCISVDFSNVDYIKIEGKVY